MPDTLANADRQQGRSENQADPSNGKLRVLVFTTVFPSPPFPLHGTFVMERIRHLAALADVRVVAPVPWFRTLFGQPSAAGAEPILTIDHPRFWYVPKLLKSFRGLFLFLSVIHPVGRLQKSFDFDVIDAHFAYPDGFAAILIGRWFRRPVCITLRGTIIPLSKRPLGRWVCNWAIRRAERIIAVSNNLADRARAGQVAEHRIAVIENGVDGDRFHPMDRAAARRQLDLSEEGRILVSVGHLSPRKGFHRVIRSMPRIIGSCPDARLVVVGGPGAEQDNSAELKALAQRSGLADRILFVGSQTPDRVSQWLGAADMFVLASDFEGCPNVILEAMACGRPIVATKVGDIERMVPDFAGLLVDDPDDEEALATSIIQVLRRDWDRRRIRSHVAKQSWDGVAKKVLAQWHIAVTSAAAPLSHASAITSGQPVKAHPEP